MNKETCSSQIDVTDNKIEKMFLDWINGDEGSHSLLADTLSGTQEHLLYRSMLDSFKEGWRIAEGKR
jgi:hypothetical protein